MLVICETHPVPYHVPVYRCLARDFGVPLHVIYGSDFSVRGYFDKEFRAKVAWDTDLLSGYEHSFLTESTAVRAQDYDHVTARGVASAIQEKKPSAVMALGYYHPLDRMTIRTALLHKTPLLFRGETSDQAVDRPTLRAWWRDLVLRRLYRRCARLLYLGTQAREHYVRLGVPPERLVFSPYCADDRQFEYDEAARDRLRDATRARLGVRENDLVILFSGKLSRRKGVDMLPAAIRSLPPEIASRVVLMFLGEGALHGDLEAGCTRAPGIRAVFTGFQNQSQLSQFYHAADLMVLPSRSAETWGVVVNEALMHGVPCVSSTQVGSWRDLVQPGSTGAVCASDDTGALAEAVTRALALEPGIELRQRCRHVAVRFSVQTASEGIAAAYRDVCGMR